MKTFEIHSIHGPSCPDYPVAAGIESPAILAPDSEGPDARIFAIDETGSIAGHVALWWKETPSLDGAPVGAIGGFTAVNERMASSLLDSACACLKDAGCQIAVGPMNGNTWRKHRFVTESNGRGPFLLEPRNPADYPEWWGKSGFSELSRYSSSLIPLDGTEAMTPAARARLERSGVSVRKLDADDYDNELRRIHAISLKSFGSNFLYTPLEESAFLDAYRKVRDRVNPDFVRIAERDGEPCGFVFGIPDLESLARGERPAVIVKTLAVDSSARCAGLGSLLVDELHLAARDAGYGEAIHALQHETNTSLKITGRHGGTPFRKYTLFSKPL